MEDEKSKERKEGKKEGGGRTSLSFLRTNQRGEGFLSHAMQEGGEGGLAICVQVRDEPIRTRLHVSHRVMG